MINLNCDSCFQRASNFIDHSRNRHTTSRESRLFSISHLHLRALHLILILDVSPQFLLLLLLLLLLLPLNYFLILFLLLARLQFLPLTRSPRPTNCYIMILSDIGACASDVSDILRTASLSRELRRRNQLETSVEISEIGHRHLKTWYS